MACPQGKREMWITVEGPSPRGVLLGASDYVKIVPQSWIDEAATVSSAASNIYGRKASRSGKWTDEELAFAHVVIGHFAAGLLPLKMHTTLRSVLAVTLRCQPMRVSKKFPKASSLGKKLFLPATDANAGFESLEAEQAAAGSERKTAFLRFLGSLDEAGAPAKSHAGSAAPTPAQGGHKRGREGGAPGGHSGGALAAPFLGRREAEAAGGPGAGFSHAYAAVEGSPQFHPVHAPPPAHYPHAYALPHSAHELQHSTGHNAYPTTAPAPRAAPRVAMPHPGSMPPPPVCVGPSHMYGMGPGHTRDEAYHMRQDPMLRHRPPPAAHHYYEPLNYDHLPAGTGNPTFHDHDAAAAGYPPPLGSIHLTPGVARALAQQLLPVLREDPRGMQGRDGVLAQDLARAVAQSEGRGHPAQGGWVGGPGAWATVPRQVPTLDLGRLVRQAYAPAPDTPSEVDRRAAPAAAQGGDKRRRMGSAVGDAAEALHALAQANPDAAHQGKASVYGVPPSE